jgi:hypothetical protein
MIALLFCLYFAYYPEVHLPMQSGYPPMRGQVKVQGSRQTEVSSIHRELVMFTVGGISQASLYVIGR